MKTEPIWISIAVALMACESSEQNAPSGPSVATTATGPSVGSGTATGMGGSGGTGGNDSDSGGGGGSGDAGPNGGNPFYAVFSSVFGPNERLNYVNVITSLSPQKIDLSKGVETPGLSRFYAPESGGFFALGQGEKLTIEKWNVGGDGSLGHAGVMSLQGAGVTQLQYTAVFLNSTKAYYLDYTQSQIVVWNPQEMTITKTVPLPQTTVGTLKTYFNLFHAVVRPGRMLVTMGWNDVQAQVSSDKTGLLAMDTDTDTVIRFDSTDRCAAADNMIIAKNGDAYYATDQYHIEWNVEVRGKTRPGCVLRIKAGEEQFDPDYLVSLADATGGKVGFGIAPTGDEGKVYISVLDESVVAWTPDVTTDALGGAAWQKWTLDLASGKASVDPLAPHEAAGTNYQQTEGRTFIVRASADYATSQIFELAPGGALLPSVNSDSLINTVARVR